MAEVVCGLIYTQKDGATLWSVNGNMKNNRIIPYFLDVLLRMIMDIKVFRGRFRCVFVVFLYVTKDVLRIGRLVVSMLRLCETFWRERVSYEVDDIC